jgi:serine/threonine protein kinase
VDFGWVKSLSPSDDPQLSMAEAIVGTPHCLAPEAIRSSLADRRSDLYALGAVGYFLLAGKHMFEGESVMEVCAHQLHSEPPALSERVPAVLSTLLMRCLAKDPAARPQTAVDLLRELERRDCARMD